MTDTTYSLRNVTTQLPATLAQYLEAQYHIWDEYLVGQRRSLLDNPGVISSPAFIEATPSYLPGAGYHDLGLPSTVSDLLTAAGADKSTGIPPVPYRHQANALRAFSEPDRELVISTGTGSGKTEGFLMPILGSLALERKHRPESYNLPGVRALLLYPMNALVNDQISRLRRLLGADSVAGRLTRDDGWRATFGMYTSRTPYPGPFDLNRTRKEVGGWLTQFFGKYAAHKERLLKEGKWPAKDLDHFQATFQTSAADSEMLTRHEMQDRPPDLLVTNYSMLEYMLLRPVDAPIFAKTKRWLGEHRDNHLIVVLDEAHLYQGAQGTEVALLLRRLVSRLRVPRNRIRFILTSASLATGDDADSRIKLFAAQLTGGPSEGKSFAVVVGELDRPANGRPANAIEAKAFSAINLHDLLSVGVDPAAAARQLGELAKALSSPVITADLTEAVLRDTAFALASSQPVAKELAAKIMGHPTRIDDLASVIFPTAERPLEPLDGLLALCAFARRHSDDRVYLPSRAHLLFRGLDGLFACTNRNCSARENVQAPTILGRLYSRPRLRCDCGARVYEVLTHRDCGAAFLRGYYRQNNPDFLWHEQSTGASNSGQFLTEIHLLVEFSRDQVGTSNRVWLHSTTGRIERNARAVSGTPGQYLELRDPNTTSVNIRGRSVVTYDRKCPVCLGTWRDRNRPKIMDLATKGEDPFAHLIATQVKLQPPSSLQSRAMPNAGRKSLLFSDGRQKAARLARDVPRVIERDSFRQTLLLAAQRLREINAEPRLSDSKLYVAFISVIAVKFLRFLDGDDAKTLRDHESIFQRRYRGNLQQAINDPWTPSSPMGFRVLVMRALGSAFYSLFSLGLGYLLPRPMIRTSIVEDLASEPLSQQDIDVLVITWIQGCLEDTALYAKNSVTRRARELAAGYPITQAGTSSGFTRNQSKFLKNQIDIAAFESVVRRHLTTDGDSPGTYLLDEDALLILPAVSDSWYRCGNCTYLAPVTWRGTCIACGGAQPLLVPAGGDVYLRARKAFWRDPVERVLAGTELPMTLDVEEHTAQLGYRDTGTATKLEATTESYERRFRDILLDGEQSIDVLSCTTTMEVGIDIGSLIAVGLRNMPPSRHNYQQRAGRAGRRGAAVSTVVTYAQNNPHDAFLFDHPKELISGASDIKALDIDNPTLVSRHVYAELLQEYFEDTVIGRPGSNVFAALGDTAPFFSGIGDPTLAGFDIWLTTSAVAADTMARIRQWLPEGANLTPAICVETLTARLKELRPIALAPLPAGEDRLIEFLFSRGVLPSYAFPRDLVSLQIDRLDARRQVEVIERPQQGAAIALSEYAPGRLVVVNKQTYRVAAVTADVSDDTVDRAPPLFARSTTYLQCPNCLFTAEIGAVPVNTLCAVCNIGQICSVTAIQPEVVWPEDRTSIDELDDDQTVTDTTVAQLPTPASDRAFETSQLFGPHGTLSHGRQVPLIIMNRGEISAAGPTGFQVCNRCGYTVTGGQAFQQRHDRHYNISQRRQRYPALCSGIAQSVYLGYQFNTDVLLLRTTLDSPFTNGLVDPALRAALTSLASGLALTAAVELDIDARELQSGHRLLRTATGTGLADIYLYDTLTGGAGYARLIGEDFGRIFAATQARMNNCSCDVSCSHCLRTYANRMSHTTLDRRLALDLAAYFRDGTAPVLIDPAEQLDVLLPVISMLELHGWKITGHSESGIEAGRSGSRCNIVAIPSLIDRDSLPTSYANSIVLSVYEIEKDLPGCLLKLPI